MRIAIIGAGNMGSAIARGLAQSKVISGAEIVVSNPTMRKLEMLKQECPNIEITLNNEEAVANADWVIVCVKPWILPDLFEDLPLSSNQVLISVAAGVSFDQLASYACVELPMVRFVPNTAIIYRESVNLMATDSVDDELEELLIRVFNEMGETFKVTEAQMAAASSLSSCGIAYVLKYVQAAMQAGVEMGLGPRLARRMVAQSLRGAASLIIEGDSHPSVEIDKVCTPGGLTIKGINELDNSGFASAIIKAMKASKE